ncbi:MAG: hydantoinase/oxoprolinase family protein, partial [Planctomycetota bacterium]
SGYSTTPRDERGCLDCWPAGARPARARRTDVESSHRAAELAERSGAIGRQMAQALALVRRHPGRTSKELARLGERIRRSGAEAIAVCLLHSFAHPEDERRVARSLARLRLPISLSSDLLRRHREYERFSTTLLNAYIQPVVSQYLERLAGGASPMELHVLRNEGGSLPYEDALEHPVRTILSGPTGGALAAKYWAKLCGFERALGFDMGGTSADVALPVESEGVWDQASLGGHALALPSIPLSSVGCGGGSIAYRDSGGALRVGPESAGADPGPAAYGKGTRPTVTDAHLFLGRLPQTGLLGGGFPLDSGRAARAIERLGRELGLDTRATALGVLDVADLAMARPLRAFTMGRGLDPADFCLVAFGGAGGLHALRLARILGFGAVLVPPDPGILSAAGMLLARPVFERELAWVATLDRRRGRELAGLARAFGDETRDLVARDHGRGRAQVFASCRYRGNQAELWVRADGRTRESFESEFEQRFGFLQELPIECLRLRARVTLERSLENRLRNAAARATGSPPAGLPDRCGPGGLRAMARDALSSPREGPLAILDYSGTTIVEEGWKAKLVEGGAILLGRA